MVSENLKDWVKQKRKEGVSDERIKKSLEETGHDPSIVDELENPFADDSKDVEPSEDVFESSNQDSSRQEEKEEESSSDDFSFSSKSSGTEKTSSGIDDGKTKKVSDSKDSSGFSMPSMPSLSLSVPSVSRKKIGVFAVLVLLMIGGYAVYSFWPSDFNPLVQLNSDVDSSSDMTKLEKIESTYSGCPDSGVRIQSVSISNGKTTADVLVTRNSAMVVLEIMKNNEVIGYSTEKLKGEGTMSVNSVGDKARLRPAGCNRFYSLRSY